MKKRYFGEMTWLMLVVCAAMSYSAVLDFQLQRQSTQTMVIAEWSQHARDPMNTGYSTYSVTFPWRWKWQWNGSNATGGEASGKTTLPRNVQPVTGGGRVYVARGGSGITALNEETGAVLWTQNPGGSINSTVAYDHETQSLFAMSSNGYLYKLNPANGATLGSYNIGGTSTLPLPPCVIAGRVFIAMGNTVAAVDKNTMTALWTYNAGSAAHTPPAYSPSRDCVVVCTADLYVHAVNNSNGTRKWRVKPSVHTAGTPYEYARGWPVIAERHGLVLVRMRIDWDLMWVNPNPFGDPNNATIRSRLVASPQQQCHFALSLDDGSVPFVCNNGQGGYGDGGYMPIGSMPVVKTFPNGDEVVYNMIRGENRYDSRWDSHFGEMVLDSTTVSGLLPGYVRWIRHGNTSGEDAYCLTDEQPFVSMAGDHLFGNHWLVTYALQVGNRSASYGTFANKIDTTNLSWFIVSQGACGPCTFSSTHYCAQSLNEDPSCGRNYAGGFYVCYNTGVLHDRYWTEYGCVTVSNNKIIVRDTTGAIFCLESGNPLGMGEDAPWVEEIRMASEEPADAARIVAGDEGPAVVEAADAAQYIGREKSVEGTLRYVFNNGKSILLGFAYPHQGYFKAQIEKRHWDRFGAALGTGMGRDRAGLYREGQSIRVRGMITHYQGDPVIYVSEPSQITHIEHFAWRPVSSPAAGKSLHDLTVTLPVTR